MTAGEKYRVDLLVETKLKGEDSLIIVHIENQSYVQPSFPERMFGCVPVTPRRLSKFDRDRESLDGSLFFHFRSRNVGFTVENTQQNRKRGAYMAIDHDRLFKELITTFLKSFFFSFSRMCMSISTFSTCRFVGGIVHRCDGRGKVSRRFAG